MATNLTYIPLMLEFYLVKREKSNIGGIIILKKKILAALLSCSIILSGCSMPDLGFGGDDTKSEEQDDTDKDDAEKEDTDQSDLDKEASDTDDSEAEASDDQAEANEEADLADFEANKPVFKMVNEHDRLYVYPDGEITLAGEYNLESLMLLDEYQDMYPELDAVLRKRAEENHQRYMDEIEKFQSDARARVESDAENGDPIHNYWVEDEVIVLRSNDRYLGYYEMVQDNWTSSYLYERNGYTYDIITGEEVNLGDVLNLSEEELNEIIIERLKEDYPEDAEELEGAKDSLKDYTYDSEGEETYNWCLSYDGIHFFFNEETLVKGQLFGNHEAVISYDEDFVNSKYAYDTSKGYCYRRTDLTPDSIDYYDGNTSILSLYLTEEEDDSDFASAISLAYKDQIATIDEYFDMTCLKWIYGVVTPDNRELVYIMYAGYDNSLELFAFEITDGNVKAAGTEWFSYADIGSLTDPVYKGEAVLSDPEAMVFGNGGDLLGSVSYYGAFKVGEDGLPEYAGDFYTISWICNYVDEDITTKVDIEAEEVDEDGNVKGSITVPAGSVVTPVRTDGDAFIDCRLEDGSLVRFTYSNTSYPISINGSELNDLFDNLCFAG